MMFTFTLKCILVMIVLLESRPKEMLNKKEFFLLNLLWANQLIIVVTLSLINLHYHSKQMFTTDRFFVVVVANNV